MIVINEAITNIQIDFQRNVFLVPETSLLLVKYKYFLESLNALREPRQTMLTSAVLL